MELELSQLKYQLNWLRGYAIISSLILIYLAILVTTARSRDVIRTKGIVIEDDLGRDRILIGAPVPESRGRFRTDLERVKEVWAPRLGGEKYLEDYATYDHAASGILFLNEQGHDKLILGEKMPDPNTGKRLVKASGLTFNDDEGFERGGLGVSRTEGGGYRVVLGMDDPEVGEAMHVFVLEDGTKGLRIAHKGGQVILGRFKPGNEVVERAEELSGISILDEEGKVVWEQNALQKK
jgi:hypothetical protein